MTEIVVHNTVVIIFSYVAGSGKQNVLLIRCIRRNDNTRSDGNVKACFVLFDGILNNTLGTGGCNGHEVHGVLRPVLLLAIRPHVIHAGDCLSLRTGSTEGQSSVQGIVAPRLEITEGHDIGRSIKADTDGDGVKDLSLTPDIKGLGGLLKGVAHIRATLTGIVGHDRHRKHHKK